MEEIFEIFHICDFTTGALQTQSVSVIMNFTAQLLNVYKDEQMSQCSIPVNSFVIYKVRQCMLFYDLF